jgi:hypothetical protein
MVLHTCEICNFSSEYTTNYKKHLNSKKHLRKNNTINDNQNYPKEQFLHQKRTNSKKIKYDFVCQYCQKNFTRLYSLNKHLNGRCKNKGQKNEEILGYQNLINKLMVQNHEYTKQLLMEKDKRIETIEKNKQEILAEKNRRIEDKPSGTYIKDSFNINNTNYVLNYFNYNNADSIQSIIPKFRLTKDEYKKSAISYGYKGALMEKADQIIIQPYLTNIEKRPIHTVDLSRKKALYKDETHKKWTFEPDITINDCFDSFHKSAVEQRDKVIIDNPDYMPSGEEDSLYKQIYFIPTENIVKDNIHKEVKNHILKETRINKGKDPDLLENLPIETNLIDQMINHENKKIYSTEDLFKDNR